VSTAVTGLIHPASMGSKVVDRLEAACAEGGSSFHGTGIQPGWAAEVLPLVISGILHEVDSILVQELMDYSTYGRSQEMFDVMGFGRAPDAPVPMADPRLLKGLFKASLMLVADGLGAEIEDYVARREVAVADRTIEVKAGTIEPGTVSAQRYSYSAVVNGREALTIENISRMGQDQAPDWPTGRGWRVTVEGTPSFHLDSRIAVHGEDDTEQGCLGTAVHAVHAIAPVCAADPGIKTFLDLPMIVGRGGPPVTGPEGAPLSASQLLDPSVIDEPHGFYRQLVAQAPVWRVPDTPVVLVSSFDAVTQAVNRPADFSSNVRGLLHRSATGDLPEVMPFDEGPGTDVLATADPPMHSVHRRRVSPSSSPAGWRRCGRRSRC